MQDLGHSIHSPKYELTISHGDPIHGPGFIKNMLVSQNAILEIHQTGPRSGVSDTWWCVSRCSEPQYGDAISYRSFGGNSA